MLRFKSMSLFFVISIVIVLILVKSFSFSLIWLVFPVVLYLAALTYGSAYIGSGFYIPVICKAVTTNKQIALSFDDGPVEINTGMILDILKQNQTPATFFCIGNRIQKNEGLLKRMDEEGHLIGNHSFSHHFFLDFFSAARLQNELQSTNEIVEQVLNKKLKLFRPPYGVTTPNLAKAVRNGQFKTIGWSLRSMDTVAKSKNQLLQRIEKIKPGDIILFHDTVALTLDSLQTFIDSVKQKGYEIVRLDKLLTIEAYA